MKDTILWQDRKRILGMPISFTKYLIKIIDYMCQRDYFQLMKMKFFYIEY